jgi:uncharacterized delta-60 repeat protein
VGGEVTALSLVRFFGRIPPLLALLLIVVPPASALPGDLDTAFGGDGKVITNVTSGFDWAYGVDVQPSDGKIVAAGEAGQNGGQFGVVRYNIDGSLDTSFGGDGKVTTNFTSNYDGGFDMVLQPDERIVVVGFASGNGGQFGVARYNADGSLDTTFSGDGKTTTNFSGGSDFAFGVAIQPADGKIVAVGGAGGSGGRIAVARYNTDGSLDSTFSGDGRQLVNFTTGDDRADLLAVQTDGKLVLAGTANYFGSDARWALVRLNADGTLDSTFDGDGKLTTNFTSGFDGAFSVAIQPADGKIVAAGQSTTRVALARYNVNGSPDFTFGGDGRVITNVGEGADYADDVVLQPDGKIVAVGTSNWAVSNTRFLVVRYNATGSLDTTFSGDGKLTTNFSSGRDRAYSVVLQADGNIVVAGGTIGSGGRFALARYLGA